MPFTFGKPIFNEGEYVLISCIVSSGDLPLTITWSLQGVAVNSLNNGVGETGIFTNPAGPRANSLSIASVDYKHSGEYTCTARNTAGNASYSATLKVKGIL